MIPKYQVCKLYDLFTVKCDEFLRRDGDSESLWIEYLNSLACSCISKKEIDLEFCRLMNEEGCLKSDVVCIPDPYSVSKWQGHAHIEGKELMVEADYILVPLDYALKILVLGEMP